MRSHWCGRPINVLNEHSNNQGEQGAMWGMNAPSWDTYEMIGVGTSLTPKA